MTKKLKRIVGVFVALAIALCGMPYHPAQALLDNGKDVVYVVPGQGTFYCDCIDDAFKASFATRKVQILIRGDREIDLPSYLDYGYLNKDTILTVEKGATLTVNKYDFRVEGLLQIRGKVDLKNSEGIMYGNGQVKVMDYGQYIKRPYEIQQNGEYSLEANHIYYGQSLGDATIVKENIHWKPSINGTWQFVDSQYVPQVGSRGFDVVFKPEYPLTYEEKVFEKAGKVTVNKAVPQLEHYEKPQVQVGEKLLNVLPNMKFVSPLSGEEIAGTFSFANSNQIMTEAGEQDVQGTFTPADSSYASVTRMFKVDVLQTEPAIIESPVVRAQGTYGQVLKDISYFPGKCINPHTQKEVKGTWEWSNPGETLCLGSKAYSMTFTPVESGYSKLEVYLNVDTTPKGMQSIEWPTCTSIQYGQTLAASTLSCTKNQYGTFAWKNDKICPKVNNQGAEVVFTPTNTDVYDWSKMPGYNEATKTVSLVIPIEVSPQKGEMPTLSATSVQEGDCLVKSTLSLNGMSGKLQWKDPKQIVEKSGWYEAYYIPADRENYSWNEYMPQEDGKITKEVYVEAKTKTNASTSVDSEDTVVSPTPYVTPNQSQGGSDVSSSGGTATASPTATVTASPTATATVSPTATATMSPTATATVSPTATATVSPTATATVNPTATPTAKVTSSPTATATVSPTATPEMSGNSNSSDSQVPTENGSSTDVDKQSSQDPTYVITQLVPHTSSVKGLTEASAVSLKKVKRKGTKVQLVWKKVSGVNYQLQYGLRKSMKGAKSKFMKKNSFTIKGLKKEKTYYVRIRAWKQKSGKKVYGKWSKVRKVSA